MQAMVATRRQFRKPSYRARRERNLRGNARGYEYRKRKAATNNFQHFFRRHHVQSAVSADQNSHFIRRRRRVMIVALATPANAATNVALRLLH